jgi:hypothetical protein
MSDADFAAMGVPVGARRIILAKVAGYRDVQPRRGDPVVVDMLGGFSGLAEMLREMQSSERATSGHCHHCAGLSGYCSCKSDCPRLAETLCYKRHDPHGDKWHMVCMTLDASQEASPMLWTRITRLVLRTVRRLNEVQAAAMVRVFVTSKGRMAEVVDLPVAFVNPGSLEKKLGSQRRDGQSDILKCLASYTLPLSDTIAKWEAAYATISHVFLSSNFISFEEVEGLRRKAWVNVSDVKDWRAAFADPLTELVHPNALRPRHQEVIALRWLDADAATPMCTICIDARRETVLQPCGHCFACGPCTHRSLLTSLKGDVCPHCRALVTGMLTMDEAEEKKVKVYMPEY